MSELMGDIRAEPKPGTALRTLIEEHRHLDEFMAMVKAKIELDEKHLTGLKTLRDSWDPAWNGSGIWPLISPLLTHINNEIAEYEKAVTELHSRFADLPSSPNPNATHEDGFDPLETLENVETRYYQYKQSHEVISAPEAIGELKAWLDTANSRDSFTLEDGLKRSMVLPKRELEYRRAVVAQQTVVKHAIKWQTDALPDTLERHQQRAEYVKSFLKVLFTCYSSIYFNLSTSCSTAVDSNRAFSSSEFIAPRHNETENEASHALLQVVEYRNYMLDGEIARPLFALGIEKRVSFINELLYYYPGLLAYFSKYESWLPSVFALEKALTQSTESELSAFLKLLGKGDKRSIHTWVLCAFLVDEPLLPLPEDVITQHRNGISRAKLSSIMVTYLPFARQDVVALVVHFTDMDIAQSPTWPRERVWRRTAICLSHNAAATGVIESIWRKWDIENDCPLPEGVERVWRETAGKSEVVWKKTGRLYEAPRPGLSS